MQMNAGKARTLIAAAVVIAITAVLLLRRELQDPSSPAKVVEGTAREHESPDLGKRRFARDLDGMAHALSLMASRTMGLALVTGRVLDVRTHEPVAGAEAVFTGPSGESSAIADDEGSYRIEILPGLYRSYARGEGFVAVARSRPERLPGPVSAAEVGLPQHGLAPLAGLFLDRHGVDLFVERGGRIRGSIVDDDQRPIAGAVVAARSQHPGAARLISGSDVTESEANGRFELEASAGAVELQVSHPDYAGLSGPASVFVEPGQVHDVYLKMTAGCIIEGTVVDIQGRPVAEGSFERRVPGGRPPDDFSPVGEIGPDGRVRFALVPDRQVWNDLAQGVDVHLRAWPWKHPPSETRSYSCKEGLRYQNEVFVIPEREPSIAGSIEDVEGSAVPLAFLDVFPLDTGGMSQQERADYHGKYSFYELPKGRYQITSFVSGKGVAIDLVEVPTRGVRLKLSGTGSIAGTTEGLADGAFRLRYRCSMSLGEDAPAHADELSMPPQELLVTVGSGRFRVDDLPACKLVGTASTDGGSEVFEVEIRDREETPLRLAF